MTEPMRVLVTGGAGFVGSHVVDALLARGHSVVVADTDDPRRRADDLEVHIGDLADPDVARRAAAGVDAVCHQAAMVGLGVDFADVRRYVLDNDLATATLLGALHDRRFTGRFVLASSMVVYGEGAYRCARDGVVVPPPRAIVDLEAGRFEPPCPVCGDALTPELVHEDAPLDPRNVYAATKLHQEHLVAAYAREHHGVAPIALRYHNVYGPRMPRDTPYAGVASIFWSAAARGEAPRVFEDGRQTRDFVHVHDVARANVLALEAPFEIIGAFNVASGQPRTVLDLARAIADANHSPPPEVVGGYRLGDVRHIVASPARAVAVLGFRAQVDLAAGGADLAPADGMEHADSG